MKKLKFSFQVTAIALFTSSIMLSCDKEVNNHYIDSESPIGTPVTNNPTETISFTDVESFYNKGDKLKLRINRTGNKIEEYIVEFEGTYNFDGEHLILCRTPEGLAVGQGDSGSPVLTMDGKIAGTLCYGFYFNNNQFCARAIEDVLKVGKSLKSTNIENYQSNSGFTKLGTVNLAYGMSQEGLERYAKNDKRGYVSNYISGAGYDKPEQKSSKTTEAVNLIAGNSICVQEISGDRINFVATGTASYIKDNKIFAFGHPYNNIKPIAIPAFVADMKTMIESGNVAFKLSVPTKVSIGGMVADEMEGILIDMNATPATFDVNTEINIEGAGTFTNVHKIAKFKDSKQEVYHAMNLPPYLVFDYLLEESFSMVNAKGTITIKFDRGTYKRDFDVDEDAYWIDWMIYDQINLDFNSDDFEGNIQSVSFKATITESK